MIRAVEMGVCAEWGAEKFLQISLIENYGKDKGPGLLLALVEKPYSSDLQI